jgi:beta-glucanase (GH16 family)
MGAFRSNLLFVLLISASGSVLLAASGQETTSMPSGDIPGWRQTFAQDFNVPAAPGQVGDTYGNDMRGYSGFPDTSGHGTYTPDAVLSVSGGRLDYYLHTAEGKPRVASAVPFGYDGQTYGRYSIRFRSDPLPGYKIAFMLWPSSGNWNEGEIDWPEGNLNGEMYPASAVKGSLKNGAMTFDPPVHRFSPTDSSDWHVATTEWSPGKVKWFWDGELVSETSLRSGVPDTNFRWTLQAETEMGDNATIPSDRVAGHLQIDWAVQYAYEP